MGLPAERPFASKPDLGLQMIRRVQARGLPFDFLACDDLYGKSRVFRATLDALHVQYAAEVPSHFCPEHTFTTYALAADSQPRPRRTPLYSLARFLDSLAFRLALTIEGWRWRLASRR